MYYIVEQVLLQSSTDFLYFKAEQTVLKKGAFLGQGGTFIIKWGSTEYKCERRGRPTDFGNQLPDFTIICLAKDNLLLGIPEKLNNC